MDGLLTQVFGDFGPGVVSPKRFLVDILLKDVAQHVGIDLIIFTPHGVIQVPGIATEKNKQQL
ncbi:MAG: hypothetical protein OEX02_20270, partial [Cyclobacteriaceae bacterium]|nr:hypothetical protein [Cyclobacteriaceae bacterium]